MPYTIAYHLTESIIRIIAILYELYFHTSVYLLIGLFLGICLNIFFFFFFSRKFNILQNLHIEAKLKSASCIQSESMNFENIKSCGIENISKKRIQDLLKIEKDRKIQFEQFISIIGFCYRFFEVFSVVLFFYLYIFTDLFELSLISVSTMIRYLVKLYEAMRSLLKYMGETKTYFLTYYYLDQDSVEKISRNSEISKIDHLEVYDLKFHDVFSGLNAVINKNEKIAVFGKIESGKTVFLRSLAGLGTYEGIITINGKNIDKINRKMLYQHLCYISQNVCYTDGSIMKNLQYGNSHDSDYIIKTCKEYKIDKALFSNHILDYDKYSETTGKELSVGQKQRIHLMRGVLKDSSLLLVDNCFSGISICDKNFLINKILDIKNKTIICAINDHKLLSKFDKIILIDKSNCKFGTYMQLKSEIDQKGY